MYKRQTLDGAHVHLIAAKYLRDVSYEGSGEGTRIRYEFEGEIDPELVGLLTDMKVSRPVAEALVTDHPDRIRPAVKAVRQRINEGYRPRSLAATMVDAVRNPEKYDVRSAVTNTVPTKARAKAQPEPQPVLLPLNREELLGMVRSILRVKLGRVPRDEVVVKLAALNADQVDRLVAAARGQEDLVKAVEELVGEPV